MYYHISAEKPKLIVQPDGWMYFETPSRNSSFLDGLKARVPYRSRQWDRDNRAWLIRETAISADDLADLIEETLAFRPEIQRKALKEAA